MKQMNILTVSDLAGELGLTERTVREAIKRGDIPASKLCGRWYIDLEEAKAAIKNKRMEGVEHD